MNEENTPRRRSRGDKTAPLLPSLEPIHYPRGLTELGRKAFRTAVLYEMERGSSQAAALLAVTVWFNRAVTA